MKHVFTDVREIAHLWMSQAQGDARNGQGNFYFSGRTIYSYGSHFPIATIEQNEQGERCVLLTTRTYSPTTQRHVSIVRRALDRDLPVFNVNRPGDCREWSGYLANYHATIKALIETIKPRTREAKRLSVFESVTSTVSEANRFAEFFGLPARIETPESLASVIVNIADAERKAKEAYEFEQAKRRRKAAREATVYRRKHAEFLAQWRETGMRTFDVNGECIRLNLNAWPNAMLRFDSDANEVHTSMGAVVPVEHAHKAFQFVARLRAKKQEWKRNGHTFHVGYYSLDSIDAKGNIKVGCHQIEWSEIQAFAERMNWSLDPTPNSGGCDPAITMQLHTERRPQGLYEQSN